MRIAFVLIALSALSACGGGVDGELVFTNQCATCHGADGAGTTLGPDLNDRAAGLSEADIAATAQDGLESTDAMWPNGMDPINLTDDEADAVAAYVFDTFGG